MVSLFEPDMLQVYSRELEPTVPSIAFLHPIPSGNSLNRDVVFSISAGLSLKRVTLGIRYYDYQHEVPLG